jgi:hypothetical protein
MGLYYSIGKVPVTSAVVLRYRRRDFSLYDNREMGLYYSIGNVHSPSADVRRYR